MNYYLRAFKKYAEFKGRDNRPQYWYFSLIHSIIYLILDLLGLDVLAYLYITITLIPGIAIGVRRLHDIGKSGWWLLVAFIPLIGWIWLIILLATKGDDKSNQYGEVPGEEEVNEKKDSDNKEEKHHEEEKINESENKDNLESNDENQLNQG